MNIWDMDKEQLIYEGYFLGFNFEDSDAREDIIKQLLGEDE